MELFPHDDHRETQQHRIDHADDREFESRNLVVLDEMFELDRASHQETTANRQARG
jgi:hypothetical protein